MAHVALRYILPLLVFWLVCGQLRAAIINVPADYATISLAVAAASPGDEIVVAPGTYNENVIINTNNLTLRSSGGKAVTTIQGSAGVLGTILIQANGITIGGLGQGFTIKGYDNPSPAIEYAAIYIQGVRSNITIRGNEIVADGEAGLLSEFGNAVNNLVVSGNVFSGKTFVGPEAGDCGFANQFTAPNVPRQLVNIPTGSTITFTSNEITGTAGSSSSSSDPVCATFGQGNTLVTIDANNATIRGNTFAGTTTRFGHSLRVRGTGANISCNTFDNTGLGLGCVHIFFNATALGSLGTPNTLAGVADANVFVNEGAYFTGATQIYRSAAQVLAIPQTPILANSTPFPPVTNVNTGEIFCSIQSAIDDPFTLNGHTLSVAAGTYKEIVTVSKSLTILGPNAAINPCTGTRVAEAILMPPASQPFYDGATEVILMEVQAADVTVKGLTFDGDNPALTNSDGGPIDAADGLDVFSNVGGLLVENNIFKNLNEGGVTGYPSGVPAQTNNTVIHNRFENIPGDVGTGYPLSGYGISVLIYNNFYTNVEENCMDEVRIGVQTGNYHLADPGSSRNIKNNQIQSKAVGIFHNLHYSNASPFTVEDNTISADDPGNTGIILWSFQGSAGSTVKNNVISGGTWGIEFWNNPTSSTITVEGGSITGAGTGVLATNYSTYGDAASTTVAIKGVTISGSTVRAVHVEDSPSNTNGATIALQIKDDCDVVGTGTLTGVLVDGADASALIQNNNASIHGFAVGIDVNGGTATITGNHIYDNGIGIRFRNSGSGSVTNNDFTGTTHNGTDLRLDATAGTVNADGDNHFAGINFGVDNQSAAVVDAENNYWNHPSGPSAPPQAFGTGAKISNNVDYCPFYGAPGGPALPASACACGSACPAPVTFTGNITISTQAQMDAFKNSSGCKYTHVTGNLTIDGNGNASTGADVAGSDPITDLCNLQELLSVGGNLVIRDFNVPGNPTNLNDLSNLQTVGNNFTIGTGADNNTSFAGSSLSFPNLTSVGNNLNVTNNPGITGVSMPNLAGTVNSIDVHTNGNAVATIDLSSVTAVTGAADFLNNVANATAANVNLGALTTVGGLLRLNRTAASINLTSLTSVGGNLVIDNNAGPLGTLNIPSLNQVGGTLSIDNNDITAINIPTAFTAPSTALTITGNTGLTSVTVGILSTTGNATVQNNGTGVTTINLSNLQTVGGNLSMNNNAANAITAAVDLSALTGVTGNMTLNRTLGTVTAPVLTNISGDFTANNNGTWTNLDASFPVLATVGGNLSLQNNSMLSTCCRLLCDIVVAGTKTISGNATGCATMANITSTCAGSECPSGFTRNTDPGECNYTSGGGEFDLTCPASTITYAYSGPGGFSGSGVSTLDALDFPVGTTTITATITTSSPVTTGTCTFTVTVNDNEPPVVTPGSIASCYPSILSAETAAIGATTATDNCGTPTKTASTSMSGCTATITVTATDGSGNTATTTYTTSIDNTPPTVTTGTIAACYPTVAAAEAAAIAATTATDACSTPTLTASTAGTCSATITVTATDACGNTASVTYTTSIDNTPPTVTAGTIAACYPTVAAAEAAAIAATTATDACSTPTLTASTAGTCSATITVTATDACGNTASVTYTTTIDGTPPTVTAGTIAACYFSIATAEAAAIAATTATDACSTPTKTASTVMSGCTATITVTATDACGNTASVTYTTSIDGTAPTVTAGSIAACYPTVAAAEAAAIAATTATDACGTPTLTASTTGTCSASITVTATDACGNSASVTYTTTIDGTPPTLTCPPTQMLILGPTCSATLPDYTGLATVMDNCALMSVTQAPAASTTVSGAGPLTVTLTATDNCGNTSTCTFTVNKVDITPPMVTCFPDTITFNGEPSITLNPMDLVTATDNCGIASITLSPSVILCSQLGQTVPVTVTVTDINSNVSTCTSNVFVDGLPCGWSHTSGSVGCNSTASYNTMTGVWTAGATNCFYGPSYNADAKAFVQRPLCGNGSITVRVTGINVLATGWAGIVMRDGNAQGAKKIQLMTNLSNFHRREVRTVTNGMATIQQFPANNRYWLRLVRQGNQFSGFISPDGVSWFFVMAANIDMPNCIQMGLVLTNYTPVGTTTATFDNVSTTGSLTPMMAPINAPIDLVGQEVELDFSVFPNPTEGQLNLDISKYLGRQVRVELYSAQGQLVKFSELDEVQQHVERMDISEQAAGMYIVRLKSPGVPDATKRVILSKMWRP